MRLGITPRPIPSYGRAPKISNPGDGDAQNIGFAIAVDQVRQALPDLLDVERRYRIVTGLRVAVGDQARVVGLDVGSPAQ